MPVSIQPVRRDCGPCVAAGTLLFAVAALTVHPGLRAQAASTTSTAPTATTAPKAPASAGKVMLKAVVFRGNSVVSDTTLQSLAAPYIGMNVTLTDLETLAAQVTQVYRAQGYFLALAVVPQQAIQGGTVEISVLEGRLGKVDVRVAANAPISEQRIRAITGRLRTGVALEQKSYERAMLLMSDLPGIRVQAGLEQGLETGTTDLIVEVAVANRRWEASVDVDNFGTQASGRERASASVRYASPFRIGDNIDARLMSSSNAGQSLGRLSYEAPIGARGLRVGVGGSRVGYELGGQYQALGVSGTAQVVDASLSYPLIRSRARNLFLRATGESKRLRDQTQAVGIDTHKNIDAVSVALNWEARDTRLGGGYFSAGATAYTGRLRFRDDQSRSNDQSALGRQTEGRFSRLNLQASRLQALFGRHNLYGSVTAQLASRNLDASEKLALGGDRAVRAYPSGELLVDTGWMATAEWRYSATDDLVVALFYDAAQGRQAKSPGALDTTNSRQLRGPGIGVTWNAPYKFTLRGSVAWRNTEPAVSDGGSSNPRLMVQVQKAF